MQPAFRFPLLVQMFMLVAAIFGARDYMQRLPDRVELGLRISTLRYNNAALDRVDFGPARLAGAWIVTSEDSRFGGFSGLDIDRGRLLAVGDNGAVAWLDKPGAKLPAVSVTELPDGPGDGRYKGNRDAEALRADPAGRGWWVSFERANAVWLYDRGFTKVLGKVSLGESRWPLNGGIEGLVADKGTLMLFIEGDSNIFRVDRSGLSKTPVRGRQWRFSEAIRLRDGRLLALERTLDWSGFRNALVFVESGPAGHRIERRVELPLGPFDNMEGMAAEQLPDGKTRLWLIADDNFERPMRTLLLALDLPGGRRD